ncbi:MAG TPA: ATP-binding protein [Ktedonobacterales bacterium]
MGSTHHTRTTIAGTSMRARATRRRRLEALVQGQTQVLEMITRRLPLPEILEAIARWVEAQSRDGVLVSLLLLDAERQHLLHGAAPSLPASYNNAIHGLAIGPSAAACGTAAYRRERVIAEDIATDPLWESYRHLALRHGLRACWSTPLIGRDGDVLGTFAMYYRQPRRPTADDLKLIDLVSRTTILAIEQKQAEEERERLLAREQQALRQAEAERQRLHGLFMEAPALIAVFRGPEHVFELANPLYMRSIGQGREVLGKPIRAALSELEGQGNFELLDEVYTRGESCEGHEVLVRLDRRGDGALEDRFFDFTYQPSRNGAGEVDGVLVHAADVTELVRARRRAEESEEQKEDFISIAGHELKTPLTSLKAQAQLLAKRLRREGNAGAVGVLGKMDLQLNNMTRLIGDLLDDAKLKGGKLKLQPSSFDYTVLVRECIEVVQRTAAQHTLDCDLAPDVTLTADRERIGEVVTNLLTNAVKYSPDADRVVVRVAREDGEVVTSVRDFGIGIPAEQREHVFDRFFRATAQGEQSYPGLGLGLYIAAVIVRRHGGRIWVESEEGRGSTFAFALPAGG